MGPASASGSSSPAFSVPGGEDMLMLCPSFSGYHILSSDRDCGITSVKVVSANIALDDCMTSTTTLFQECQSSNVSGKFTYCSSARPDRSRRCPSETELIEVNYYIVGQLFYFLMDSELKGIEVTPESMWTSWSFKRVSLLTICFHSLFPAD